MKTPEEFRGGSILKRAVIAATTTTVLILGVGDVLTNHGNDILPDTSPRHGITSPAERHDRVISITDYKPRK